VKEIKKSPVDFRNRRCPFPRRNAMRARYYKDRPDKSANWVGMATPLHVFLHLISGRGVNAQNNRLITALPGESLHLHISSDGPRWCAYLWRGPRHGVRCCRVLTTRRRCRWLSDVHRSAATRSCRSASVRRAARRPTARRPSRVSSGRTASVSRRRHTSSSPLLPRSPHCSPAELRSVAVRDELTKQQRLSADYNTGIITVSIPVNA